MSFPLEFPLRFDDYYWRAALPAPRPTAEGSDYEATLANKPARTALRSLDQEAAVIEVKIFDIRDRGTDSAAFGMKLAPKDSQEEGIVERMGFRGGELFFLVGTLKASANWITYDQYDWRHGQKDVPVSRTMFLAHGEIVSRWDELRSGETIDVSELRFDPPPVQEDE